MVSDLGKSGLNNVSVVAAINKDEEDSVIIHGISLKIFAKIQRLLIISDFGLDYEFDEHSFLLHHSNRLHDVRVGLFSRKKPTIFSSMSIARSSTIKSGVPSLPKPALWIHHSGKSLSCRSKLVLTMEDECGRMEMETRLS